MEEDSGEEARRRPIRPVDATATRFTRRDLIDLAVAAIDRAQDDHNWRPSRLVSENPQCWRASRVVTWIVTEDSGSGQHTGALIGWIDNETTSSVFPRLSIARILHRESLQRRREEDQNLQRVPLPLKRPHLSDRPYSID